MANFLVAATGTALAAALYYKSNPADPSEAGTQTIECVAKSNKRRHIVLNKPDSTAACELLGEIEARICRLTTHLHRNDPNNVNYSRLASRMKYTMFNENAQMRFETFTADKGASMSFCLRDDKDKLYPLNLMMFVAIHELAHVMSVSFDHTKEFNSNFAMLLREAEQLGLYTRIDFNTTPVQYCSVRITTHP
jgi:hypothetical protein